MIGHRAFVCPRELSYSRHGPDAHALPAVEPTVLLADALPLIHLAMIGALDLTLRFGPVVVPDAVEIETTFDQGRRP